MGDTQQVEAGTSAMVPMIAPDGSAGQVPAARVKDALAAGGKIGVEMLDQDGNRGTIPLERYGDGLKAGGKLAPEMPNPGKQGGFWGAVGSDLASMGKGLLFANPAGQAYQALQRAKADYDSLNATGKTTQQVADERRKQAGYNLAYRMLAPAAESAGVNVQGMEDAAKSGDVNAVLGHAAVPAAAAVAPLAGEAVVRGLRAAPAQAALTTIKETASNVADVARNNPVTNAVLGPSPEALEPAAALEKSLKPRNSIKDFSGHADRALPDIRRAADALQIDPQQMTLPDAEKAIVQAKKDVWSEIEQNYLGPNQHVGLDTSAVADRMNNVVDGWTAIRKKQMGSLADEIQDGAANYDGQVMNVRTIEDRIQELNNELRSQQNTFKVKEAELRNDPKFAGKFAELDGLRELESKAIDSLSGEGLSDLKQRYGSLKVMQDVVDRRIPVYERQNPVGGIPSVGRIAGAGNLAGGAWETIMGHPSEGVPQMGKGFAQLRMGQNLAKLNDSEFLLQHALTNTEPRTPFTVMPRRPIAGMLPAGPIELGPSMAEDAMQVLRARSQVIRDPRTGRMRKQYVTSGVAQ